MTILNFFQGLTAPKNDRGETFVELGGGQGSADRIKDPQRKVSYFVAMNRTFRE